MLLIVFVSLHPSLWIAGAASFQADWIKEDKRVAVSSDDANNRLLARPIQVAARMFSTYRRRHHIRIHDIVASAERE